MKILGILVAALIASGCVPYPVYKTLQPKLKVQVSDPEGMPVENASVELIANSFPYNREKSRSVEVSDDHGKAEFRAKKEWRIEAIMLRGAEVFYWNWCVRKSGYLTEFSQFPEQDGRFPGFVSVVLSEGQDTECPRYGFGALPRGEVPQNGGAHE